MIFQPIKTVRLAEIAQHLGVASSTVSRAWTASCCTKRREQRSSIPGQCDDLTITDRNSRYVWQSLGRTKFSYVTWHALDLIERNLTLPFAQSFVVRGDSRLAIRCVTSMFTAVLEVGSNAGPNVPFPSP